MFQMAVNVRMTTFDCSKVIYLFIPARNHTGAYESEEKSVIKHFW